MYKAIITILFLGFYSTMLILCYRNGWMRARLSSLELLTNALEKKKLDIFLKGIVKERPPVWYEVFLTSGQIKQIDKEKLKVEKKLNKKK